MTGPDVACHDDRRRALVRETDRANGIDYIEVNGNPAAPELHLYLLRALPNDDAVTPFTRENITFPDSSLEVNGFEFRRAQGEDRDDIAVITLKNAGDRSTYSLRLEPAKGASLEDVDPRYRSASFSFVPEKIDIDCVQPERCPPEPDVTPNLDYLAKDYASFRQLLLDRLAVTLPGWRNRNSPDLYLTLVEVLAYAADHLSYAQDAVTTEAYLETARLRTSVRRHARLIDYPMHEGCNARAWVCLEVAGDPVVAAEALSFVTRPAGVWADAVVLLPDELRLTPRASYEVFEPLLDAEELRFTESDIRNPAAMIDTLLKGKGKSLDQLRSHLTDAVRDLLTRENVADEDRAAQIAALADLLNSALSDLRLAREGHGGLEWAAGRYGTPNALTGPCLCRHNKRTIEETFPKGVARAGLLYFYEAHNTISFYTWHAVECCLPKGATSAVLRDAWVGEGRRHRALEHLRRGHLLVLEERLNPRTGNAADVDPGHRHVVRLTNVNPIVDPLGEIPVVEVTWDVADALPFPLVLSTIGPAPECAQLEDVSVAHGNVVLVDHGETVREPDPARLRDDTRTWIAVPFPPPDDIVPPGQLELCCVGQGRMAERPGRAGRYEPVLARSPLVFSEPLPVSLPASKRLRQDPRQARPQIALFSPLGIRRPWLDVVDRLPDTSMVRASRVPYERWRPRRDLLASDRDDRHFVVEVDDHGLAHLRFGDGELGARPAPDTRFLAWYRIGGGTAGNVGDGAIGHAVLRGEIRNGTITAIRNPLPAQGGTDPEPVAEVRLKAPHAFRARLDRAIVDEDYAAIVMRDFGDRVQGAAATIAAATGGAMDVTVRIDLLGGGDDDIGQRIEAHLEDFRRIGHSITVEPGIDVPIALTLTFGVSPQHRAGAVRAALGDRFSNRLLSDGSRGFFHPDSLMFGQDIAISELVAAAWRVPGVAHVDVTRLQPVNDLAAPQVPVGDVLKIEGNEIARLAEFKLEVAP